MPRQLRFHLTPPADQIAEAQRLAQEWKPKGQVGIR
jgi:hypothetical protein